MSEKSQVDGRELLKLYSDLGNLENDFRNKALYAFVASYLYGKSLLEIGFGAGHFVHLASKMGFSVTGIDSDNDLLKLARKLYGNKLNLKKQVAEDTFHLEKKVDSIVMIDVLEHIKDDVLVLNQLKKILKKNGRLIIFVPMHQFLYGERDRQLGHYRRYSVEELTTKLRSSGYNIIIKRYWNSIGFLPYLIIEKLLNKRIPSSIRSAKKSGPIKKTIQKLIYFWLYYIENKVSFGFGLSYICVATNVAKKRGVSV